VGARRSTTEQLILAAERLYGERGVDAVSLRQVAEAAGQRNPAVVQYHFGDRDGLLRAIVEYRVGPANAQRMAMLDELERSGCERDLRGLVEAAVQPLLDALPPDSHYLRFVAQLEAASSSTRVFGATSDEYGASSRRIAQALDALPEPIRRSRTSIAFQALLQGLANPPHALPFAVFVGDLVGATVAFLQAPPPT
jgi:AcrR family transcriptional regulator